MKKRTDKATSRKWWLLVCCTIFISLTSCSPEQDFSKGPYEDEYLHLTFSKTDTKAAINPDGSGNFSEGDKIGLYINNGSEVQYRELTYKSGQWEPQLRRSEFGTGDLTLSAHYPAVSEGGNNNINFEIKSDQRGIGKEESDLLFARSVIDKGRYDAVFSFRHLMHRLKIEIEGASDNVTILTRSKTAGSVNLLDGTTLLSDDNMQWINSDISSNGEMEVIIFPQSTEPYRTEEGLLKITKDNKEVRYKVPESLETGERLTAFESGKETNIRLKISNAEESEWANKTAWVYGIQPPEEGAWKQLFPTANYTYYLKWEEKYGWYDVHKRNPSDLPGGIEDGLMCWAASSSNLLHWWINQNKEYIDRYIEEGKYKGPDYHYNAENAMTEDKQESEIFQTFLNSFHNEAGHIEEGVNWFIHGIRPISCPMKTPINNAGYFKDVFPEGTKLCRNIAGMGKETFNNTIKDALINKKGIGINSGYVRSSHAMTIWGAEFDENGDVSYIYMVDNNDRDQYIFWGYGCMKMKIVYIKMPEGGTMAAYKIGYVGEPDDSYVGINRLYTLELGTEYFEKYFNK